MQMKKNMKRNFASNIIEDMQMKQQLETNIHLLEKLISCLPLRFMVMSTPRTL